MARKAQQSADYQVLTVFLRELRHEAGLTQRGIGARLKKPQSWVHNCESGNRRVDIAEFIAWSRACDMDPSATFGRFVRKLGRKR